MSASSEQPEFGSSLPIDEETEQELAIEASVVAWLKAQVDAEILRIKQHGSNAIPMSVINMCIVREGNLVLNRVEMDTKFDFNLIKQIMISEPVTCPLKEGFVYVNVLLFTDKPLPIIIPYLYKQEKANKLKEWILINADGIRVRHRINSFS